jgi:hypothetical protein
VLCAFVSILIVAGVFVQLGGGVVVVLQRCIDGYFVMGHPAFMVDGAVWFLSVTAVGQLPVVDTAKLPALQFRVKFFVSIAHIGCTAPD